jgi:hypothetical protein
MSRGLTLHFRISRVSRGSAPRLCRKVRPPEAFAVEVQGWNLRAARTSK